MTVYSVLFIFYLDDIVAVCEDVLFPSIRHKQCELLITQMLTL